MRATEKKIQIYFEAPVMNGYTKEHQYFVDVS